MCATPRWRPTGWADQRSTAAQRTTDWSVQTSRSTVSPDMSRDSGKTRQGLETLRKAVDRRAVHGSQLGLSRKVATEGLDAPFRLGIRQGENGPRRADAAGKAQDVGRPGVDGVIAQVDLDDEAVR